MTVIRGFNRVKYLGVSLLILFFVWYILAVIISSVILPKPLQVLKVFLDLFLSGQIFTHIYASVKRNIIGFLVALVMGSGTAYVLGLSKKLEPYITPIFELLRPIPPIAWIPLAILWFGIGDNSSYFIIFVAAFFPIFTNVYFGVRSVPNKFIRLRQGYKLNGFQNFVHIVFPFSLPYLLTGCKTSIGFAWMAVIAAEIIAAHSGLGYFIEISRVLVQTEKVIAVMVVIGIIGYLLHQIVLYVEKRLIYWGEYD